MLFFVVESQNTFAQEVKPKIDRIELDNGLLKYRIVLTQAMSTADTITLTQAFLAKEGIKIFEMNPGSVSITVQTQKHIRPQDINDIIVLAGYAVAVYNTTEPASINK
jgi:hypothetical protein